MKQSVLTVVAVMFVCLLNCSCGNETSKDTLTRNTTTKKDPVAKQKVIIKPNGYKGNLTSPTKPDSNKLGKMGNI